jgi:hypothetical protein
MRFDRDVLDFTMGVLGNLEHQLGDHGASRTVARTRKVLQGIRDHDSLRSRYQTICNQALVLLVSYFASAVADLFRQGVAAELERGNESPLLKEEIHISFRELVEADYDVEDIAPNLLIQTKDISFQDMKSISRAFQDHLVSCRRSHVNGLAERLCG